ncbi:uncharacterized protein K460DRAFT_416264 [Cucurbitaria berberidis CBS 394.84]|uniref:Uncharacterized protein n=1 Tax=Cucurbitaria berberidis CBS 394.84 TaxID=1168544 RepID=A0A9P4GG24_9PLEO|nr:uncharacterized protein K460DRAFT_416264 [Cucurbitaria berberidis CBS 394.84]KAF1844905.1 hypothetical protein K460DRAFT_416264 [Cucurbitaria berberidis CBS 394.84]
MEHIASLLNSKIEDLGTLQENLHGSILVALDTEGITQHFNGRRVLCEGISEIGVAVFCANGKGPDFIPHLNQFYEQNDIEAFTIRVRERKHGPAVGTMTDVSDDEAGPRLQRFLLQYEGRRILVGFSFVAELKWMADDFPALATMFTEWVDVQDLVSNQRMDTASSNGTPPDQYGLYNTLKAMRISGWRSTHQRHRAANDAVKTLAVLSGLLSNIPLQEVTREAGVSVYDSLPPLHADKRQKRHHNFTARISAADGDKLPLQTPNGLAKHYRKYQGLTGVGFNSQNSCLARGRVKYWWVAFRTLNSLNAFIADMHGSTFEDTKLRVVAVDKMNRQSAQGQLTGSIEAAGASSDLLLPFDDLSDSVVHPFETLFS